MIRHISIFLQKYKNERNLIESKLSFKEIFLFSIYSVFINAIIFLIPSLVVYNLFIIDKLIVLNKILVYILLISFTFSYNYFFTVIAKNTKDVIKDRKFNNMIIMESLLFSLVLVILTTILMTVI